MFSDNDETYNTYTYNYSWSVFCIEKTHKVVRQSGERRVGLSRSQRNESIDRSSFGSVGNQFHA